MNTLRMEVADESTIMPKLHARMKVIASVCEVPFAPSDPSDGPCIVRDEGLLAGTYDLFRHGDDEGDRTRMTIDVPTAEVAFRAATPTGFLVTSVEPGPYAAKNGIRSGDVLRSIEGHAVDGDGWWSRFVLQITAGPAGLVVQRDGVAVTLELSNIEGRQFQIRELGLTTRPVE